MAKTILVVDDSASVRQVVKRALEEAGYKVLLADNGKTGLEQLNGQKVHLVITDVNMPIMDGIRFVSEAKQNPKYKFTPVIMLTTEASDQMKDAGRKVGVRAWMVKPFQAPQMLKAVEKLVPQ